MDKIVITDFALNGIINEYCSCGGSGPDEQECIACAIYHDILNNSQRADLVPAAPEWHSVADKYPEDETKRYALALKDRPRDEFIIRRNLALTYSLVLCKFFNIVYWMIEPELLAPTQEAAND